MTKFKRQAGEPYTLITPLSPLADLEQFLKNNIFALGELTLNLLPHRHRVRRSLCTIRKHWTNDFFLAVTDRDRKFVLGVATAQDLENFVTRRGSWFTAAYLWETLYCAWAIAFPSSSPLDCIWLTRSPHPHLRTDRMTVSLIQLRSYAHTLEGAVFVAYNPSRSCILFEYWRLIRLSPSNPVSGVSYQLYHTNF